jgi:hypothetical protein
MGELSHREEADSLHHGVGYHDDFFADGLVVGLRGLSMVGPVGKHNFC